MIHTSFTVTLLLHMALFFVLGLLLSSVPEIRLSMFDVQLVRSPGFQGNSKKTSASRRGARKAPKPGKPARSRVIVPTSEKIKNASFVPELPQVNYAQKDSLSNSTNQMDSQQGGDLEGSGGTGINGTGRGTGDGEGEGSSNSGIVLGYPHNLLPNGASPDNIPMERETYFEAEKTPALLVSAQYPDASALANLKYARLKVQLTVPGPEQLPMEGIPPQDISILETNTADGFKVEQYQGITRSILESSMWYPERKLNKPQQVTLVFYVYIYGLK